MDRSSYRLSSSEDVLMRSDDALEVLLSSGEDAFLHQRGAARPHQQDAKGRKSTLEVSPRRPIPPSHAPAAPAMYGGLHGGRRASSLQTQGSGGGGGGTCLHAASMLAPLSISDSDNNDDDSDDEMDQLARELAERVVDGDGGHPPDTATVPAAIPGGRVRRSSSRRTTDFDGSAGHPDLPSMSRAAFNMSNALPAAGFVSNGSNNNCGGSMRRSSTLLSFPSPKLYNGRASESTLLMSSFDGPHNNNNSNAAPSPFAAPPARGRRASTLTMRATDSNLMLPDDAASRGRRASTMMPGMRVTDTSLCMPLERTGSLSHNMFRRDSHALPEADQSLLSEVSRSKSFAYGVGPVRPLGNTSHCHHGLDNPRAPAAAAAAAPLGSGSSGVAAGAGGLQRLPSIGRRAVAAAEDRQGLFRKLSGLV